MTTARPSLPLRAGSRPRSIRGFNIVELVVVVIILGLLTLILTPVVTNRARSARVSKARQDVERIADAMERAAIDTGFYFRLYVLNDIAGPGDGVANEAVGDIVNALQDVPFSNVHTSPERIFIRTETEDFDANFQQRFADLIRNETAFGWRGPYIADWKSDVNFNDWPDDPWGNDYLLFTRVGGLYPNHGLAGVPQSGVPDSQFVVTGPNGVDARIFDRPTILSMGPDGLPGDGSASPNGDGVYGMGDDIFIMFGGGGSGLSVGN